MKGQYLVVGLGRFGASAARALTDLDQEVLGLDIDEHLCERIKGDMTHVVQGDARDPNVLRAIDVEQFEAAIVAMAGDFEASVLVTLNLRQMRVPYVLAEAASAEHLRVLELTGADRAVFPKQEAGDLAAYQVLNPHLLDILRLDQWTSIAAVAVGSWVGRNLRDVERASGLTGLGVFRQGQLVPIGRTDPLAVEDRIVLAGQTVALRRFAREE